MTPALGAIASATLVTCSLDRSVAFLRQTFGWDVLGRDDATAIVGVASAAAPVVRCKAVPSQPPGRRPRAWDPGLRLLGVYSRNLDATVAHALAAGGTAGSIESYPYAARMREVVLRGPDDVLWTVPDVEPRRPSPVFDRDERRLCSELHSAVITVPDLDAALAFFAGAGGMRVLFDGSLRDPAIVRMIGLPDTAWLRIAVLSAVDERPARLEVMQFFGVEIEPGRAISPLHEITVEAVESALVRARLLTAGGYPDPADADVIVGPAGARLRLSDAPRPLERRDA